jgi:hypothetical protein
MASKRHQRKKACEWKRSYPTLEDAIGASLSLRRRTGARTTAYRCPFCGQFHHGHTASRTRKVVRAKRERGY